MFKKVVYFGTDIPPSFNVVYCALVWLFIRVDVCTCSILIADLDCIIIKPTRTSSIILIIALFHIA